MFYAIIVPYSFRKEAPISIYYMIKTTACQHAEGAELQMKKLKTEQIVSVIAAVFVIFFLGFYVGRNSSAAPNVEYGRSWNQNALNALEKETEQPDDRKDINTATAADIEAIPGIGAAIAEKILQYREETGGLTSIEELRSVPGIGEKTLEKIKTYFTVR